MFCIQSTFTFNFEMFSIQYMCTCYFEMFPIQWTCNFEKFPILSTLTYNFKMIFTQCTCTCYFYIFPTQCTYTYICILRCSLFNEHVILRCFLVNVHIHVTLRCSLHNQSIRTLGEGTTPLATEVVTSADCLYRSSWGVDRGVCKLRPSVLINYKKKINTKIKQ